MYRMTEHAKKRAREMGLTNDQVVEIVLEATTRYRQTDGARAGQEVCKKGDYAAVTNPDKKIIITVLFNTQEQYKR